MNNANKSIQPYAKHPELTSSLIKKPYVFTSGLFFTLIGWSVVLFNSSLMLFGWLPVGAVFDALLALLAPPFWILGTLLLMTSLNLAPFYNKAYRASKILLMFPFLMCLFFISTHFLSVGIYGFILGLGLWLHTKNIKHRIPNIENYQPTASKNATKQANKQSNSQHNQHNTILSVEQHAASLSLLLSDNGNRLLAQLITALNKLAEHQHYLQEQHAYLATSVNELIKDLTNNTIVRLNTLAQGFAHQNEVDAEAKAFFLQEHETQIKGLLQQHLNEVNELNKCILEKKMASFNEVGSEAETVFRNTVMELKILLRWIIAKTPDNQVSSHEVILKKLEESTLKQMKAAFFLATTSQKQKDMLQQQAMDLLAHFKSQSASQFDATPINEVNLSDTTNLLEYKPNTAIEGMEAEETQAFIEFNAAYVKQLKQYWH